MRQEEVLEKDQNKFLLQLSRDVLERVFRLAEISLAFLDAELRYSFYYKVISDLVIINGDYRYIRYSYAMYQNYIQYGGFDNRCLVCYTQSISFKSRPPELDKKNCIVVIKNEIECFIYRDRLTQSTLLVVLLYDYRLYRDCIENSAIANRYPKYRNPVLIYRSQRKVRILSPAPSRAGTPLPPPSIGGTTLPLSPRGENAAIRNQERDRLLSKLFYIYPKIQYLFKGEKRRL